MQVREYITGDEQEIAILFKVVFGRQLDLELWYWRFIENPCGEGIIRLMFDDRSLIGHYAVTPTNLWFDGEVHKAAFSLTTMTHPDYWGRGVFPKLAAEVYGFCKESGIEIVFGFPNQNSYDGFTRKLGWRGCGRIKGWVIGKEPRRLLSGQGIYCEELSDFNKTVDGLWARSRNSNTVTVQRTSEYCEWRYMKKPGKDYTTYGARDREGVLQGIIVLKLFPYGGDITGHIIDCIAEDKPDILQVLLNRAADYFTKNGVARITCWSAGNSLFGEQLDAMGFHKEEWSTFFGVKVLDNAMTDLSRINNLNRWRLTMGDSDVF